MIILGSAPALGTIEITNGGAGMNGMRVARATATGAAPIVYTLWHGPAGLSVADAALLKNINEIVNDTVAAVPYNAQVDSVFDLPSGSSFYLETDKAAELRFYVPNVP